MELETATQLDLDEVVERDCEIMILFTTQLEDEITCLPAKNHLTF